MSESLDLVQREAAFHRRRQGLWMLASAGLIGIDAVWMAIYVNVFPNDHYLVWLLILPFVGLLYCCVIVF
jgi:hypothetical protein